MDIHLECVSKRFGSMSVLTEVTTRFAAGCVHCVTGENGSGKTTLLNLIGGQSRPSSGRILYGGRAFPRPDAASLALIGVARLFQEIRLFEGMTALDNVLLGFQSKIGESVTRSLIAYKSLCIEKNRKRDQALSLLAEFGMPNSAERIAGTFSFGESKMVAFARMAAGQPSVLLLDEPMAGLSSTNQQVLLRWLKATKARGACIVAIEHGDVIASEIGDRLYHLQEGHLVEASCVIRK